MFDWDAAGNTQRCCFNGSKHQNDSRSQWRWRTSPHSSLFSMKPKQHTKVTGVSSHLEMWNYLHLKFSLPRPSRLSKLRLRQKGCQFCIFQHVDASGLSDLGQLSQTAPEILKRTKLPPAGSNIFIQFKSSTKQVRMNDVPFGTIQLK